MAVLKVSVGMPQVLLDNKIIHKLHEFLGIELVMLHFIPNILLFVALREALVTFFCDQPTAVVEGQHTGRIVSAGQHHSVVKIHDGNVLIWDEVGKGARYNTWQNF